jgi:hypothetical protein
MDNKIKNLLLRAVENLDWKKIKFSTKISDSGSSRPAMFIEDYEGEIRPFRPSPKNLIFDIDDIATTNFNTYKTDPSTRFNKVEFEVYRDGSYTANYYWDEAEDKAQKLKTAEVFPHWLNDRMISLLFSAGYGDEESWQNGVFRFTVMPPDVNVKIKLYNQEVASEAFVTLPQFIIEDIISHYEITNNGLLSDTWQKWNIIILKSPHNTLDLEKDVEYRLEDSVGVKG